eukprot:6008670-Alexandrium_andersonii.AAC.1
MTWLCDMTQPSLSAHCGHGSVPMIAAATSRFHTINRRWIRPWANDDWVRARMELHGVRWLTHGLARGILDPG